MIIMVYSLFWVMQDLYHQPYGARYTHRLLSSSFLGLLYRILKTNHKKELLWSLWVPKP